MCRQFCLPGPTTRPGGGPKNRHSAWSAAPPESCPGLHHAGGEAAREGWLLVRFGGKNLFQLCRHFHEELSSSLSPSRDKNWLRKGGRVHLPVGHSPTFGAVRTLYY